MEQHVNNLPSSRSESANNHGGPHIGLDYFPIPMALISMTDGVVVYANAHFKKVLVKCVVGQPLDGFLNTIVSRNTVLTKIDSQQRYAFVKKVRVKDALTKLRITVTKCDYINDEHFLVCIERLDDVATAQQSSVENSNMLDRPQFVQALQTLLTDSANPRSQQYLCGIDIDKFRLINERFGFAAGDFILQEVYKVIHEQIPSVGTLARLGNNEFGLLLPDSAMDVSLQVCEGIRLAIKDHQYVWQNEIIDITVSIGVVPIQKKLDDIDRCFGELNIALQTARDNGRDRVHSATQQDTMMAFNSGNMQYAMIIEDALRNNSFQLYAQPIVSLSQTAQRQHYEVLLRSYDEKQGDFVSSQELINAAESTELITKVDRWVCNKVFELINQQVQSGKNIPTLSVNISGYSIVNSSFETFITGLVERYPIALNHICFEITESVAVKSIARAQKFIANLKEMGFKFSLDDFGVGYCSFNYLQQLDVDYVKIDGAFVSAMLDDTTQFAMVKAITDVARAMRIKTIAEYVEKPELINALAAIGVDYGQGYHFGKPESIDKAFQVNT